MPCCLAFCGVVVQTIYRCPFRPDPTPGRSAGRPLFLALFRHARALSERGCHRTALEFCKLLLSIQPADDPLGAVLLVCHYALRAHEYQWLVRWESGAAVLGRVERSFMLDSFFYSSRVSLSKS